MNDAEKIDIYNNRNANSKLSYVLRQHTAKSGCNKNEIKPKPKPK